MLGPAFWQPTEWKNLANVQFVTQDAYWKDGWKIRKKREKDSCLLFEGKVTIEM